MQVAWVTYEHLFDLYPSFQSIFMRYTGEKYGRGKTETYIPDCKTPGTILHGPINSNDLNC
jgi:hypothetical protein